MSKAKASEVKPAGFHRYIPDNDPAGLYHVHELTAADVIEDQDSGWWWLRVDRDGQQFAVEFMSMAAPAPGDWIVRHGPDYAYAVPKAKLIGKFV